MANQNKQGGDELTVWPNEQTGWGRTRARKNIFWLVTKIFGMKLAARFFGRNDNIFPSTQQ